MTDEQMKALAVPLQKVLMGLTATEKITLTQLSFADVDRLKRDVQNVNDGFYMNGIISRSMISLVDLGLLTSYEQSGKEENAFSKSKIVLNQHAPMRGSYARRRPRKDKKTPLASTLINTCVKIKSNANRIYLTGNELMSVALEDISEEERADNFAKLCEQEDLRYAESQGKLYKTALLGALPTDSKDGDSNTEYLESFLCVNASSEGIDTEDNQPFSFVDIFPDYTAALVKTPGKLSNFLNPDAYHVAYIRSTIYEDEGWIEVTKEFTLDNIDTLLTKRLGVFSKNITDRYNIDPPTETY